MSCVGKFCPAVGSRRGRDFHAGIVESSIVTKIPKAEIFYGKLEFRMSFSALLNVHGKGAFATKAAELKLLAPHTNDCSMYNNRGGIGEQCHAEGARDFDAVAKKTQLSMV